MPLPSWWRCRRPRVLVKPRVLVVDDVPENREVVVDLLKTYHVPDTLGVDDKDARQAIADFHPTVMLIDVAMPGEDGTVLAAWVRATYPEMRIVMYSAFPNAGSLA